MSLLLQDCSFFGPALPEPFVKFQLEEKLRKLGLLPKDTGAEGKQLQEDWDAYRRKLRNLTEVGGERRVANHVLEPLAPLLGHVAFERQGEVSTREGEEDGGWLFRTEGSDPVLRAWSVEAGTDLDAPSRRGRAYRFSPTRIAHRVLLANNERVGLLTDGQEIRILLSDPARPESHIAIRVDAQGGWRSARKVPDSFRLVLALCRPNGVQALPEIVEDARLSQTAVTEKLREQARRAVEGFIQGVLQHPENRDRLVVHTDQQELARALWREGLVLVYRLLFVLKLESSPDPARAFSFASSTLWKNTYSPSMALGRVVERVVKEGIETGGFLEHGLRGLFRLFTFGLSASGLKVSPLGGMLFGTESMPIIDELTWGEKAAQKLLQNLLWTEEGNGTEKALRRVYYGPLDVEDLGRVYEALLELEPGISTEPMCRLRRAKLEVVVPAAQGAPYRGDGKKRGGETTIEWIEDIPADRFYLRVGLGRKASGSYYTPHAFVRFLVQETLGPQLTERSPKDDPQPGKILELTVLDPAMGSGHFLVEACRYLGEALYEACRLADELATEAERAAENAQDPAQRLALETRAAEMRRRIRDLPDPDDELVRYLPSHAPEAGESGLSERIGLAHARRLVAVHCIYGVDKNPLAVELAKLSLWLESYAEGLPLTFLDHRLVAGDSLTGPFAEHLTTYPRGGQPIRPVWATELSKQLGDRLSGALAHVRELDASVGKDVVDLAQKRAAKAKLDAALAPFRALAAAWAGGVMLAELCDDLSYEALLRAVAGGEDPTELVADSGPLRRMVAAGRDGLPYDIAFPEIFHSGGRTTRSGGFSAVLGNPPWDAIKFSTKEFLSAFDVGVMDAPTKRERQLIENRLLADPAVSSIFSEYQEAFEHQKRTNDRLFEFQKVTIDGDLAGRQLDTFRVFMERNLQVLGPSGYTGVLVPSAFHANAGASGVRKLYLDEMALKCCFSFENRRKLFEIDSRFKFALVVAQRDHHGTVEFECAFYLHDVDWLFGEREPLRYSRDFVQKTGGEFLAMLELRSRIDEEVVHTCSSSGQTLGAWFDQVSLRFRMTELHMSHDSDRFEPNIFANDKDRARMHREAIDAGSLVLHEGKTFSHYDDSWGDGPRYLVPLSKLVDRKELSEITRFFRPSFREIASATNERTATFCMLPPGSVTGHKAPSDQHPDRRPNSTALVMIAIGNSFTFDYLVRARVQSSVSLFILRSTAWPRLTNLHLSLLAHCALRLTCNHASYEPLWREQLRDEWRETAPPFTWPILDGVDARWSVQASIDAAVALAYGLDVNQYSHLLSSFSHSSHPKARDLCLTGFDELRNIGLDAFCKRHDPYWDVPLRSALPSPVITLPAIEAVREAAGSLGPLFDGIGMVAEAPLANPADTSRSADQARRRRAERGGHLTAERDETYEIVRALLNEKKVIASRDVQEACDLKAAEALLYLKRLVEDGWAVQEGQKRGTRYRLRDGAPRTSREA